MPNSLSARTTSSFAMSAFPSLRMRRTRHAPWSRDLVRENALTPKDLIYPVFVRESNLSAEVSSFPGVQRLDIDGLLRAAEQALSLGVSVIHLFPVVDPALRNLEASEAFNEKGILVKAVQALKKRFPQLGVITDVALDPYTSHGQDGLVVDGKIHNDLTLKALERHTLVQAQAGSDVIAPSEMMDGRVATIRQVLESNGFHDVAIMAYAAKYASNFYGPFRDALQSKGCLGLADKMTYQMDPANGDEALREVALDLQEGADYVMIKPGLPYLDIVTRVKQTFGAPTIVYQVSGEYAMIKAAAAAGYLNFEETLMETAIAFKRAGADGIITYGALELAAMYKRTHQNVA